MKSRIRKKLIKSSLIIVDIEAIPKYIAMNEWFNYYKNYGIIIWSSRDGEKPQIIPKRNSKAFVFKDKSKEKQLSL
jgi:hypothetical protein